MKIRILFNLDQFQPVVLLLLVAFISPGECLGVSWDWAKWWSYDGISGPQFWGLINPDWSLCTNGRRQSPINVDPSVLLLDPNLRAIKMDKHKVSGHVNNTGHSVVFTLDEMADISDRSGRVGDGVGGKRASTSSSSSDSSSVRSMLAGRGGQLTSTTTTTLSMLPINVTGGPLSYRYKVYQVQLHFGSHDYIGSEHLINGTGFPAEVQIYAFNSQLFQNETEAITQAHGIAIISIMVQVSHSDANEELRVLTEAIATTRYLGNWAPLPQVSVAGLLPATHHYFTYDGSLTQPPCHETVTWIIFNKPIYISRQQLHSLRQLHQGSARSPKAKMANNIRPTQSVHQRPIRTNIDFNEIQKKSCASFAFGRHILYTTHPDAKFSGKS